MIRSVPVSSDSRRMRASIRRSASTSAPAQSRSIVVVVGGMVHVRRQASTDLRTRSSFDRAWSASGGTNSPEPKQTAPVAEHAQLQRQAHLVTGAPLGPDVLRVLVPPGCSGARRPDLDRPRPARGRLDGRPWIADESTMRGRPISRPDDARAAPPRGPRCPRRCPTPSNGGGRDALWELSRRGVARGRPLSAGMPRRGSPGAEARRYQEGHASPLLRARRGSSSRRPTPSALAGLRDRALLSVMFYNFACVSAVLGMRHQDDFWHAEPRLVEAPREGRQAARCPGAPPGPRGP